VGNFKYLHHLYIWNVVFALVCIATSGKMIDVLGVPLSISIFYFPFLCVLSDVLTEVYGYAQARKSLWYIVFAQLFAVLVYQFVVYFPASVVMTNNQSFVDVLSAAPQLVLFGTVAVFLGDIANNYVLAKMKVMMNGRAPALRFVASTIVGQFVNTAIFYVFGLWGILPIENLMQSIVLASIVKIIVEIVMLPASLKLSSWLKQKEGIDVYDRDTDFNPLKL
jgi:queuosine precursor transporter